MSGSVTPATVGNAIALAGSVVEYFRTNPPRSADEVVQHADRFDAALQELDARRFAIVRDYHHVEVRLERFREDAAEARRAVARAKGAELCRLREQQLEELEDEIEHLERQFGVMATTRNAILETTAIVRRGQRELRRYADRIAVARQAHDAEEAKASALWALEQSHQELVAVRDAWDRRTGEQRGRSSEAMQDPFVRGLILEHDENH